MTKISFLDFWPGFNPGCNIFYDICQLGLDNVKLSTADDSDVIFTSLFGGQHVKYLGKVPIINFIGEPRRFTPAKNVINLSFCYDSKRGKNYRLPLWLLQLDWFRRSNHYGNPNYLVPLDQLFKERKYKKRENFAISIFNHDPVGNRIGTLRSLFSKGVPVYAYGKLFGNSFSGGEAAKIALSREFLFAFCYENSDQSGYHTEKLIHAYYSGCIPVYWGSSTHVLDFNQDSYLTLCDFDSPDALIDKMLSIAANESEIKNMISQPLFHSLPTIADVVNPVLSAIAASQLSQTN